MWVSVTTEANLPSSYAKINLIVAGFDCFMFWLWGNSFLNIFAWCVFGLEVTRVGIAYLLLVGVKQRNVFKCKTFCVVEFLLLCCMVVVWSIILSLDVIGPIIYAGVILGMRLFGIRIIAAFITTLQSERGETTSFLWNKIQFQRRKPLETVTTCYNPNEPSAPPEP